MALPSRIRRVHDRRMIEVGWDRSLYTAQLRIKQLSVKSNMLLNSYCSKVLLPIYLHTHRTYLFILRSLFCHIYFMCTQKYISYIMWPQVLSKCTDFVQLAGKRRKIKYSHLFYWKDLDFFHLFIYFNSRENQQIQPDSSCVFWQ